MNSNNCRARLTGTERTAKARELREVYEQGGISIRDLAKRHGLPYQFTRDLLHEAGVPGRRYGETLKGEARSRKAGVLAGQYMAGFSIRALAEVHGMSYGRARKLLLEMGIRLRGKGGRRPRTDAGSAA
ncbi:helix-turn-helix domain-containing protein [Streptomyces sp. ME03-5709C]|nr:helix-turn-helix domain-containing protein [Streptomyces sp. ME03-5709C]